ncbi:DUF1161 domain-containing protein [Pragia fontium]|uniref:DUF1161 domain-containing protein n=1 Tax=Pragia fontium TaxID=82985 RepID=UPI00064A7C10|nr:DUF1161 domain-containing protein [Pragia fontium]AKJ42285.1 hypothetical protein QQ39_09455 [Pragia fontium]
MKKLLLALTASAFFIGVPLTTSAATCDEIKAEISQKIISNGVPESGFQLNLIPTEQTEPTEGKVVGNCDRGQQKIIYIRGDVSQLQQPATTSEPAPVVEEPKQEAPQPQTQP